MLNDLDGVMLGTLCLFALRCAMSIRCPQPRDAMLCCRKNSLPHSDTSEDGSFIDGSHYCFSQVTRRKDCSVEHIITFESVQSKKPLLEFYYRCFLFDLSELESSYSYCTSLPFQSGKRSSTGCLKGLFFLATKTTRCFKIIKKVSLYNITSEAYYFDF